MDTHSAPGIKSSTQECPISVPEEMTVFGMARVETAIQTTCGEVYGIVYYQDPQTGEIVYLPLSLQPQDMDSANMLSINLPSFKPEIQTMTEEERDFRLYSLAIALLTDENPIIALVDQTFNQKLFHFPDKIEIPPKFKFNTSIVGKSMGRKTNFAQEVISLGDPQIKVLDIDPSQTLEIRERARIKGVPNYFELRGPRTPETARFDIKAIITTIKKLRPKANEWIVITDNGGYNERKRKVTPAAITALSSELIILTEPPAEDKIMIILIKNPGLRLFRYKNSLNLQDGLGKNINILKSEYTQQLIIHQRLQFVLGILALVEDPWYKIQILGALRQAVPQIVDKYRDTLDPKLKADMDQILRITIHEPTPWYIVRKA